MDVFKEACAVEDIRSCESEPLEVNTNRQRGSVRTARAATFSLQRLQGCSASPFTCFPGILAVVVRKVGGLCWWVFEIAAPLLEPRQGQARRRAEFLETDDAATPAAKHHQTSHNSERYIAREVGSCEEPSPRKKPQTVPPD